MTSAKSNRNGASVATDDTREARLAKWHADHKDALARKPDPEKTPASDTRWLPYHVALKDLPRQKKWANSLAFKKEREWARQNPTVDSPVLFIPAQDCVTAGASEADMEALHKLTLEEMEALRIEAATIRRTNQLKVDEASRRMVTGGAPLDLATEILTLSGLARIEPVRPLIEGFIARGQLSDLNGAPGLGKTMAAVSMAGSIASGKRWCGHAVPERAPVLYVAAEGASGIRVRLLAWCGANGVAPEDIEDTFLIAPRAVQMGDDEHMAQVLELVKRRGIALVVFDTRARCTIGVEENSATEHGRVIARADEINQQTGAAVLVVHHTAAGSDRARGTTAWDGAVWSSLLLTRSGGKKAKKSRKVEITCAKHKEWPDGCTHEFRLADHTVSDELMPNTTALQRSTLVLTGIDPLADEPDDDMSTTKITILDLVTELGGGEGLSKADIVKFAMERGCSRSRAYAAITELFDKGKQLVKVPGSQRLAVREAVEASPDTTNAVITDAVGSVGSPTYVAAVDTIITALCARRAEGRITDDMPKTDAHKLVGGHAVPFAEAWNRWVAALRPDDPKRVDTLRGGDSR